MTVSVDTAAATMSIASAGFKPDVHIGTQMILLHCTKGANLAVADTGAHGKMSFGDAITFTGNVSLLADAASRADEVAARTDWTFGFVQFCNVLVTELIYGGRLPTDGAIRVDLKRGYTTNPSLDWGGGSSATSPINLASQSFVKTGNARAPFKVTVKDGDNIALNADLILDNRTNGSPNYLFSARRDLGFVTALVARDPGGKLQFLCFREWHVIWHAELRWTSGTPPTATRIIRHLAADIDQTTTMGPPTRDAWQPLVANPAPPTANDLLDEAVKDALDRRRQPIIVQTRERLPEIPSDFFT
jgi:hypothetical protein